MEKVVFVLVLIGLLFTVGVLSGCSESSLYEAPLTNYSPSGTGPPGQLYDIPADASAECTEECPPETFECTEEFDLYSN